MPKNYTERLNPGFDFEMVYVEGGAFLMGSKEGYGLEQARHFVRISSFYIAQYPVSQGLWKAVLGKSQNPSYFKKLFVFNCLGRQRAIS